MDCVKCKSYRIYNEVCMICNTNQFSYKKKLIILNLNIYGFEKLKPKFSLLNIFNKNKNKNKYSYNGIIAKVNSSGSKLEIEFDVFGEKITISGERIYKNYNSFSYVLNEYFNDKKIQRKIKLNKLGL